MQQQQTAIMKNMLYKEESLSVPSWPESVASVASAARRHDIDRALLCDMWQL